mmetsp:Transcript_40920/g.87155  ORF Transcript_40920/g.87155 Transcript_40920/m.87155 type:complete len:259 (+) Transcript_40920:994-1770(+)
MMDWMPSQAFPTTSFVSSFIIVTSAFMMTSTACVVLALRGLAPEISPFSHLISPPWSAATHGTTMLARASATSVLMRGCQLSAALRRTVMTSPMKGTKAAPVCAAISPTAVMAPFLVSRRAVRMCITRLPPSSSSSESSRALNCPPFSSSACSNCPSSCPITVTRCGTSSARTGANSSPITFARLANAAYANSCRSVLSIVRPSHAHCIVGPKYGRKCSFPTAMAMCPMHSSARPRRLNVFSSRSSMSFDMSDATPTT